MNSGFKIDLRTNVYEDGIIEHITSNNFRGIMAEISRELVNTKDSNTKEALIKLGWTPPCNDYKCKAVLDPKYKLEPGSISAI